MKRLAGCLGVPLRVDRRRWRRIRVADPLEVGQAVQVEVRLDVETPVRDDAGDDVKVKAVGRQIELEEPMDCAVLGRLVVVGPPDRIEAGSSPPPFKNASGPNCSAVGSGPCWNRGGP
jgi:hypothetical protein